MNWQGRNRKGTIPGSRWSKQSYTVTGSTLKEKTNDSAAFSEKGNLICASELLHRGKEWTGSAFVVPVRYWSPRKSTTDFTMKYHAARHLERLEITHTRTYKHTHTHTYKHTGADDGLKTIVKEALLTAGSKPGYNSPFISNRVVIYAHLAVCSAPLLRQQTVSNHCSPRAFSTLKWVCWWHWKPGHRFPVIITIVCVTHLAGATYAANFGVKPGINYKADMELQWLENSLNCVPHRDNRICVVSHSQTSPNFKQLA